MQEQLRLAIFVPIVAIGVVAIWYLMWREDFDGMRSEADYRHDCRYREHLEAFYQRFYARTGIDPGLVGRLVQFQAEFWKVPADLVRPQDNYVQIAGGGDADNFIRATEREFGIQFSDADCQELFGSFDSLLRFLSAKQVRAK